MESKQPVPSCAHCVHKHWDTQIGAAYCLHPDRRLRHAQLRDERERGNCGQEGRHWTPKEGA